MAQKSVNSIERVVANVPHPPDELNGMVEVTLDGLSAPGGRWTSFDPPSEVTVHHAV